MPSKEQKNKQTRTKRINQTFHATKTYGRTRMGEWNQSSQYLTTTTSTR